MNLTGDEFFENLAASSFSAISNLFCDIAEQIFEYFGELEREPYLPNASISRFEYEDGRFTLTMQPNTVVVLK